MIINWIGHSCFRIIPDNGKVIVTDPFEGIGIEMKETYADILLISHGHGDHSAKGKVTGTYRLIEGPGEYQEAGISITGFDSYHDNEQGRLRGHNTIFRIRADGLTVAHLGDLGCIPAGDLLEALRGTGILLVPVGGNYTIGPAEALEVASLLEPKIIIPMHYRTEGVMLDIGRLHKFEEAVKGNYAFSSIGSDTLNIEPSELGRRTKVIALQPKTTL